MKDKFYIHGTNQIVDLKDDSKIMIGNWDKRFEVKYSESITYHEIYNREDYIKSDCRILPGDVVIDCGGNIGIFTAFALDQGASRVLSFEPFKDNYELNKKNNPNAQVFNLAVFNKSNESAELFYSPSSNGGHSIIASDMENKPEHYEHRNLFVKTITLDDIISENFIDRIDFLKIDTEGSELMIMEGISNENLSKVRNISMEYHHNVFNYDEDVYQKFIQRFLSIGFNTFTWILDDFTRMLYISRGDVFIDNLKHNNEI